MRWAVVQDSDGSGEYQKVVLTPSNWYVTILRHCISISHCFQGKYMQEKGSEWYRQDQNARVVHLGDLSPRKAKPNTQSVQIGK
jgi:hypothetical protein